VRAGRAARTIESGIWRSKADPDRRLEVIGAAEGFGHLALLARDELGAKMISPDVLARDYELAEGRGERVSVASPTRRSVPPSLLTTQDPAERKRIEAGLARRYGARPGSKASDEPPTERQLRYLGGLCRQAGEEMPKGLSKQQASEQIDRLKGLLASREQAASGVGR